MAPHSDSPPLPPPQVCDRRRTHVESFRFLWKFRPQPEQFVAGGDHAEPGTDPDPSLDAAAVSGLSLLAREAEGGLAGVCAGERAGEGESEGEGEGEGSGQADTAWGWEGLTNTTDHRKWLQIKPRFVRKRRKQEQSARGGRAGRDRAPLPSLADEPRSGPPRYTGVTPVPDLPPLDSSPPSPTRAVQQRWNAVITRAEAPEYVGYNYFNTLVAAAAPNPNPPPPSPPPQKKQKQIHRHV